MHLNSIAHTQKKCNAVLQISAHYCVKNFNSNSINSECSQTEQNSLHLSFCGKTTV